MRNNRRSMNNNDSPPKRVHVQSYEPRRVVTRPLVTNVLERNWRQASIQLTSNIKQRIRSIITHPKFTSIKIPATSTHIGPGVDYIWKDMIVGSSTPGFYYWITVKGSPYKNELVDNSTEDQVVNYVTKRILNGTYRLNLNYNNPTNDIDYYVDNVLIG